MGARRTSGEGSIYQRASDGRWVGVVDLGWVGGKRVRKTVTAHTLRELRPKFRALKQQVEQGVVSDDATVEQWLRHWLDEIAPKRVRPRTLAGYRSYVDTWLIPHLGKRRLDKLRPDHVRALHRTMEDAGKSDATRRQAHAILSRALKVAEREGRIPRNVATLTDPPPVGKGSHGALTLEEARAVLRVLDDPAYPRRARWACALLAGLRQGEALGLRWEDVDLDAGTLRVERSVQRIPKQGLVVVPPKSATSRRVVPLLPVLVNALLVQGRHEEGYVWGASLTAPLDPRRDWQEWRDLLTRGGVRSVPLHAARATTASLLMAAGVADKVTSEILGHAQVSVTQRHYLHGDDTLRRQGVQAMGELLDATKGSDDGS